jgi:hypothetical protein
LAKKRGVEGETQFRMMASLEQQLVAAPAEGFLNFPLVGIDIRYISIGVARDAIEVAEFAVGDADIGGIDIPVDLPGYFSMRDLVFTQLVGYLHQFGQGRMSEEKNPFFFIEKFFIKRLIV